MVSVPVLSNTIVFTIENLSKTFPPRQSIPLVAPKEVPTWKMLNEQISYHIKFNLISYVMNYGICKDITSTAVGVAKPSAHGQATT